MKMHQSLLEMAQLALVLNDTLRIVYDMEAGDPLLEECRTELVETAPWLRGVVARHLTTLARLYTENSEATTPAEFKAFKAEINKTRKQLREYKIVWIQLKTLNKLLVKRGCQCVDGFE